MLCLALSNICLVGKLAGQQEEITTSAAPSSAVGAFDFACFWI